MNAVGGKAGASAGKWESGENCNGHN